MVDVLLQVWGVPGRRLPAALTQMATGRWQLRGTAGLRFAKLLGTGHGRTFTPRDADPGHWAVLTVWDDAPADQRADEPSRMSTGAADHFLAGHRLLDAWDRIARERLDVRLSPLSSRGRWSGRGPFGRPVPQREATGQASRPVASLTRARIRPREWSAFWRSVPAVSADLRDQPGLRLALGLGEAPVGWQGTFSLWEDAAALTEFAHRRAAHVHAVEETVRRQWYAEELFARFAVRSVHGRYAGRDIEPIGRRPAEPQQ